jgi:cysteinyl-tRNA synthetase
MHGNMLTVNGEKMSKSKGNSFLPLELFSGKHPMLKKGFSPMTVRFFMLQTHYSSTLDFSNEALEASEKGFQRLMNAYKSLPSLPVKSKQETDTDKEIAALGDSCKMHMDDDFNTPKTIASLFDLSSIVNKINDNTLTVSQAGLNNLQAVMKSFIEDVLGLAIEAKQGNDALDSAMGLIIEMRKSARENKDWTTSDKIRDELGAVGIAIKDGKEGTSWSIS